MRLRSFTVSRFVLVPAIALAMLSARVVPEARAQAAATSTVAKPAAAGASTDAGAPAASTAAPESTELARLSVPTAVQYPTECKATGRIIEKRQLPNVDPPSAEQQRAFGVLSGEFASYEKDAKDFRNKLTTIVRHHYEERRRQMLEAVDKELKYQKAALTDARNETIERLEAFVARYSGDAVDPEATPDAMFRLAALYEERARDTPDADLTKELSKAISLYREVASTFPAYRELAAVLYYLGHAYLDSGRLGEAQQSWRTLACSNHFQVLAEPGSVDGIVVAALPQDHPNSFWEQWYNKNPIPLDQLGRAKPKVEKNMSKERAAVLAAEARAEELSYIDPYAECQAVPQVVPYGQEPRYLAEVWWQIGNYHFDEIDPSGGPYNLNRAVSAYDQALLFKQPPLYGVANYKQAWTYFKQQRYRSAVEWFVKLLEYADQEQARTGDPGADFRAEAYTYIGGSLTYVDLDGPRANDPYIARSDVLDVEMDPVRAEERMAVAIERVQDPTLIPQDKPWTVEIYKSLAREFVEISQNRNAILVMELLVKKFPLDRDAPLIVNRTAELYDELSRLSPRGSEARTEFGLKALEARTSLSQYVGVTPWTDANRDDAEALIQAEQLVKVGLRRAAADHTNYARAYKDRALQLSDAEEQRQQLSFAIQEYRLAAQGWGAYLAQDESASDAYESRFWLADSHFWVAVLQVPLDKVPTEAEVEVAYRTAREVRDSNEGDDYRQPAAFYVVTLSEKLLDAQATLHASSAGSRGLVRKEEVSFTGEGAAKKPVAEKVPEPVLEAVCARDEYNERIPLDEDPQQNGLMYAIQSADYFFVYGQFAEARRRLVPIYERYCGENVWGYKAWERLVSMSNFESNAAESRALVESKRCSVDPETRMAEDAMRTPVRQGVAYMEARKLFEKAQGMQDGPEREATWRAAAAAYKVALAAAPDRDEAPEAAMNGAYAYKQVGEYDKAIAMYSLFIEKYGDEKTLAKLKKEAPDKYAERVQFLGRANEALASAYVLFFDYPKAAETFDRISSVAHFDQPTRKAAAKQALLLYVNLDDKAGMARAEKRFVSLGATEVEQAEAEYMIASSELKKWDPNSPDTGKNEAARNAAMTAMSSYYEKNRNRPAANRFSVHAAYHAAVARRVGKSHNEVTWWQNTIAAFSRYVSTAPKNGGKSTAIGSEEASLAAEAEYTLLDRELIKEFDYETGHHRYAGTIVEVLKQYGDDAKEAKVWYDKLQHVVDHYVSQKWATVAIARQGSVYDSLRTGLYNTRAPELKMFTPEQERALARAEASDNEKLLDQADQIRTSVRDGWRQKRDQELDSADRIVVDRYSTSVVLARRYNVSEPGVTRAIRRLAFLAEVAGEAKMSEYTSKNKDLGYKPGMFQRMRPGAIERIDPTGDPPASPNVGAFGSTSTVNATNGDGAKAAP